MGWRSLDLDSLDMKRNEEVAQQRAFIAQQAVCSSSCLRSSGHLAVPGSSRSKLRSRRRQQLSRPKFETRPDFEASLLASGSSEPGVGRPEDSCRRQKHFCFEIAMILQAVPCFYKPGPPMPITFSGSCADIQRATGWLQLLAGQARYSRLVPAVTSATLAACSPGIGHSRLKEFFLTPCDTLLAGA